MQVITRLFVTLITVLLMTLPAAGERPRPLGLAIEAARDGSWDRAARLAGRDGDTATDIIEWMRLRDGRGSYSEVISFLSRNPDWPGEARLRRQSETVALAQDDSEVLAFFAEQPPQSASAALRYSGALRRAGQVEEADAIIVAAWRNMAMSEQVQSAFLKRHSALLAPHHDARVDTMLWRGAYENARRSFALASDGAVADARARIALHNTAPGVDRLIAAIPESHKASGGLQYERFNWRARKGRGEDAKALMIETSTSADALGRPEAWSNRRRAYARDEMRNGDAKRAYEIAANHHLTGGSAYADLEWLSGYIALRKLNDPQTALRHFDNHNAAVRSPISKGRAGYWRGRAYEAMGDAAAADQAYAAGAQHQTSFYGLLAAERAGLPFDLETAKARPEQDWRSSELAQNPVFEAGLLLQASGELSMAEMFWTHLAEELDYDNGALLAQAAVDAEQPHLAVMIGKRLARRTVVVSFGYYAMHPLAKRELPMAPEMNLAIARRESEFDPNVTSGAGARGLMQIMPRTGQEVARQLGRAGQHTTARLISDPVYNAELGAAYLSSLARRFSGNPIMMSAGYNAGPSRPDRWMEVYGDPRRGEVDIVDWIEHIPFRETRNYVMRVTESLPIYRALLGQDPLPEPFSAELTGKSLNAYAPRGE